MRKSKPVLILLSIQLMLVILLAMINPVTNLVVRTFGTEHTFETSEVLYFGDFIDEVRFCCYIKYGFNYSRFDYMYDQPERYAVIDTDENGMSYVSALSREKPESGEWLGTSKEPYAWYDSFKKPLIQSFFKRFLMQIRLFLTAKLSKSIPNTNSRLRLMFTRALRYLTKCVSTELRLKNSSKIYKKVLP